MIIGDVSTQQMPKFDGEVLGHARLSEKSRAALALGASSDRWLIIASHDDDRDVARSRIAFEVPQKLPPVTISERHLGHDDVRVRFPCATVGFGAVFNRQHLESQRWKGECVQLARVLVCIDDEHERSRRRGTRAASVHCVNGMIFQNRQRI